LRCWEGGEPGSDEYPFIPGYSAVGIVERVGKGCSIREGARVFGAGTQLGSLRRQWGGHTSHALLAQSAARILPDEISMTEACMAGLAAIAFRGFQMARPLPGETAVVIGLGAIGQGSARLFSMSGIRTVCLDLAEHRVRFARSAGLEAYAVEGSLKETLARVLPDGADIVVDATGTPETVGHAVDLGRELPWDDAPKLGTRYVVQGSPGSVPIPYQRAFSGEMSFLFPRNYIGADINAVTDLMARRKISMADCVSEVRTPEQVQKTYEQLSDRTAPAVTMAFQWSAE
jgi:2-desacetyl-2-hydroxyethyl bacteriochlorophyllide A dehydrogenase